MSIGLSGAFSPLGATIARRGTIGGAAGDPNSGGGVVDFPLYDDTELTAFRDYMEARKTSWASTGTNYQYETDSGDDRINDAQSDMYDGGNYTQVRKDGSASGNMGYNSNLLTFSQIKYIPLSYSWPLVGIAVAPRDQETRYGWSRYGNLGADNGGGSPAALTVYNNATVGEFDKVYAWIVNKSWNQNSDPGVSHLYCTVGSSRWSGSNVSGGFTVNTFAGNSDSDTSQYESTSTNCFVWTALVSKGQTNGTIDQSQAQTFVNNFLGDAETYFGWT